MSERPRRIDTHHHIVPDFYAKAVEEAGGDPSGWKTPDWSVEQAKEHLAILGIETAIVSITAPGAKIYENDKDKGRQLARKLNEFSADLVKNNPAQFGFFASLPPLCDVEGALAEIDYVQKNFKADGYTLYTSYAHDRYLGHPSFKPIWAKLNELKTVVFIHPSAAPSPMVNDLLTQPIADYPQETTRTVADLVLTGTRAEHPDVKIILSHAGGTLPYLARRIATAAIIPGSDCPRTHEQVLADFRTFHYDTAWSSSVPQLKALLEFADHEKIIFGSDTPYIPIAVSTDTTTNLEAFFANGEYGYGKDLLRAIDRGNATKLFAGKFKD